MKTLELYFEYCCSPIWTRENTNDILQPIDLDENQISNLLNPYLIKEIDELDNMYQETYNDDYPPDPLHNDNLREYIFVNRVLTSAKLLEKELRGKYEFIFDWEYWKSELNKLEEKLYL
ncbi:hypothetical protein [Capnocytophaga catalasegens]|uniref:Uncharacterized protein n=1 Tax=Capnocytophaga catalasegens TaxID=1004260 RepID=A0AAV5B0N3_9FLAO|nr:hypothetical protein [Capnocytophaga catalasegens]GIZ16533.1 hypothetical protein RCZ03_25330 [Capnocytophaga catalasegens]GJM51546.1 hypothetical protein RCZ15_25190 [Capnocytophaga catalasegens]GJM52880.1 hypothetical protein RCZ16_11970 [Capnocytophaga catalasegens]